MVLPTVVEVKKRIVSPGLVENCVNVSSIICILCFDLYFFMTLNKFERHKESNPHGDLTILCS